MPQDLSPQDLLLMSAHATMSMGLDDGLPVDQADSVTITIKSDGTASVSALAEDGSEVFKQDYDQQAMTDELTALVDSMTPPAEGDAKPSDVQK